MTPSFVHRQAGLGLVELMVGITVGLIVAAGASMIAVNQISEHRRLMLETQMQQDLRTAADIVQQDLRRAGFRGNADVAVWAPPRAVGSLNEAGPMLPASSPYAAFAASSTQTGVVVHFLYARPDAATFKYNTTGTPWDNEYFGVKWDRSTKVISIQLGLDDQGQPNWQPITDPDSILIENFVFTPSAQTISLGEFCDKPCGAGTPTACPTQTIREVKFTIVGRAKHDPNVVRTLEGAERIRADDLNGACPS